jgi:S1-C subfamily serine protease
MLHIVSAGLLALGTLFLGLAVLAWLSSRRNRQSSYQPREPRQTANADDLREFARLMTDDAPSLLQHLSYWRMRKSAEGLQAVVDEYIATSGMDTRNQVLSIYMELYGQDDDAGDMASALGSVLDKIDAIAVESSDSVATLLGEIRATSPAQLRVWSLLRSLLEISKIKAIKLKRPLASVVTNAPTSATKGIESEMALLVASLNTLVTELAERLPAERVKSKDRRRASLETSLAFLDQWVGSCPAFGTSEVAALPEGAITRHLAGSLWATVSDSLTQSGGTIAEPNWPDLPAAIRIRGSAGSSLRSRSIPLVCVAAVFYAVAGWLLLRSGRFDLDRALLNTVRIETPEAIGTGFLVGPGGWIVTNRHVVSGFKEVKVTAKRRGMPAERTQVLFARVVSVGTTESDDVAVLRITAADFPADVPEGLTMDRALGFKAGQDVHVLGDPLGLENVYTRGVIMKVENGRALMDVRIAPGSSGGPVCNDRGVVVGITTGYAASSTGSFSFGLALPVSLAWQLIDHPNVPAERSFLYPR